MENFSQNKNELQIETYIYTFIRLTMNLNDSSSIALHLKIHSVPESKFQKILVENTYIIAHVINKLRLQILEDQHIKLNKKIESLELILKIARKFWNAFSLFFLIFYFSW